MPKITTIRREGGSRVLTVTKIIPLEWEYVILTVKKQKNNIISIEIEKVK